MATVGEILAVVQTIHKHSSSTKAFLELLQEKTSRSECLLSPQVTEML